MASYVNFGKMVTPKVITVVWVLGSIGLFIKGLAFFDQGLPGSAFIGVLVWTLGMLFWRMVCELIILPFKILDGFREIRDRTYPVPQIPEILPPEI